MWIIQWLRDYSIVLMLATFVVLMVLTFWPGRRTRFERDGHIPLQDDR
jgi:cbb3-type cytochrome oxidase subunit 3